MKLCRFSNPSVKGLDHRSDEVMKNNEVEIISISVTVKSESELNNRICLEAAAAEGGGGGHFCAT